MPVIILINEVLPAPLGPKRPYKIPEGMESETASTAVLVAYRFTTRSISKNVLFGFILNLIQYYRIRIPSPKHLLMKGKISAFAVQNAIDWLYPLDQICIASKGFMYFCDSEYEPGFLSDTIASI